MESLNFHKIKLEKANAMLRYKKRQSVTIMFRFIEFCIFFAIISRFSTRLPLSFKLSIDCFKGLGVTLISPRFVFVLGNTIVIILFLKSGHSSGSTNNVKMDLYEQKCSMNYEKSNKQRKVVEKPYCEQSKKQGKQSILVEKSYCEQRKKQGKQSILVEKSYREQSKKQSIAIEEAYCEQSKKQSILIQRQLVEKKLNRSHSESFTSLCHDEKPRKELIRSATVGCLKVIRTNSVKSVDDGMSSEEFRNTVEAFIARQQRFLREEELFSDVVST
ncbi:hypothetical protein MTR67_006464 [Solanum verrucosum]|uniref:DUF4408 domain-containing protein n=1 Tax=Solanum verrucosum TaxID=315347 RepID=A0AAF0PXV9_SOLVR|nr:uncharacterized protein LOC125816681 [Solanum verrucosum]WMV13079.1 hypothetical protein MTR67_006464 [Solanum verrucosum]